MQGILDWNTGIFHENYLKEGVGGTWLRNE
jgi:hypothetical protein